METTDANRIAYAKGLVARLADAVSFLTGLPFVIGVVQELRGGEVISLPLARGMTPGDVVRMADTMLQAVQDRTEIEPGSPNAGRIKAGLSIARAALSDLIGEGIDARESVH